MKTTTLGIGAVAVIAMAAALYGAFRAGIQHGATPATAATGAVAADGPPPPGGAQHAGDVDPATGKRVLYWHDPMVPDKKFDRPGKSPFMNMMLVPVFAEAAGAEGSVAISSRVQQNLGVRTVEVGTGRLTQTIEAPGTVAWNDRDVAIVSTRVAGTVEKLFVRAPLDPVRAGEPVAELYVPDWIAAQEEFLAVKRMTGRDMSALTDAARTRLLIAGMPEELVRALDTSGQVQRRITLTAPRSGVVAELGVREGANVPAGMMLMRINGLSTVWINAEVPETISASVRTGMRVATRVTGVPGTTFQGRVAAILPEVNAATRTLKVRIETANPGGRLRPGMFAAVDFAPGGARESLVVPSEAVIRTGRRNVVIVADEAGRFRPTDVETGIDTGGSTEILRGLTRGQRVVASGQFLIDSEASLKSALTRMTESVAPAAAAAASVYSGSGVVESITRDAVMLSHGPIPALKWNAMTMEFQKPPGGVPPAIKPGTRVEFKFRQAGAGEFALTSIDPAPATNGKGTPQ